MTQKTKTLALGGLGVVVLIGAVLFIRQLAGGPTHANGAAEAREKIESVLSAAQQYLATGEDQKASAVLAGGVREFADDQDMRLLYADVLMKQRELDEAYAQYEAALAIGPRTAPIEFAAGTLASLIGRVDRAIEHYSAAQSKDMSNPDYPLYLGQVQLKTGDRESAKASLLRAGQIAPDRAVVWGTLAEIAYQENKLGIASGHIGKARGIDPESVEYRLIQARILKREGNAEEALRLVVGLDDAERSRPEILRLMGECYGMLGRAEDAAQMYVEQAQRDTTSAEIAREAAIWLERTGDTEGALEMARRASMLGDETGTKIAERLGK